MAKKKIFKKCLEDQVTVEEAVLQGATVDNSHDSGLFNTEPLACGPQYVRCTNERVLGHAGAHIVFGQDRPTTCASGVGGQGAYSPRIDLVVGRGSSMNGGDGPLATDMVDNNPFSDAARIYICASTQLDKEFGLEQFFNEIGHGRFSPRSGIAVKADHVRLIGREGVKIVTGRAQNTKAGAKGETNSVGGKIQTAPPIILCAGNQNAGRTSRQGMLKLFKKEQIADVQPMVKGQNLVDCLEELDETIGQLISFTQMLAIATSTAISAMGVNWTMQHYPGVATFMGQASNNFVSSPLGGARRNHTAWNRNFLSRLLGYKYILSTNVYNN